MADTRTLKLSLLADVNKFLAGMDKADKGTKSFSSSIGKYSKAMAKSFAVAGAAAGAYALKLGVDGVKAAIEDEASQVKLAKALQNTTNATDAQIASTEDYISKQQLSFGIADTKLRPALANLARATGDLTKAQQLNNLAIDIAAATGKDLESVSLALAKGYNGNLGALTRLGVPLDANIIKTKDFTKATDQLQKLFGGSAQANTKTLQGQLAILRETFGELQEGVGVKLIPVLKRLFDQVLKVSRAFSGEDPDGLSARARELKGEVGDGGAGSLGRSIAILAASFENLFKAFSEDGDSTTNTMQEMATALNNIAKGINLVAGAYRGLKKLGAGALDLLDLGMGVGERFGPQGTDRTPLFNNSMAGGGKARAAGGTTIIMNGVVDGESARRSIERLMQDSSRRTGAVNLTGATL
jgi:hypothetical protein